MSAVQRQRRGALRGRGEGHVTAEMLFFPESCLGRDEERSQQTRVGSNRGSFKGVKENGFCQSGGAPREDATRAAVSRVQKHRGMYMIVGGGGGALLLAWSWIHKTTPLSFRLWFQDIFQMSMLWLPVYYKALTLVSPD